MWWWLCALPALALVVTELYVRQFDGWGAWAAAPLFLIPMALSAIIGTLAMARSSGAPAAVAWMPMLWILVRRFFV